MLKRLFLFSIPLFIAYSIVAQQYRQENITLLGRWDDSTILPTQPVTNRYSGIWGYAANSREYAIIGGSNGAHIINITNPYQPVRIQFIPGAVPYCTWREYKTYSHYLYMSSDDGGPNTFQIADLSYLPDSVHLIHNSDSIFRRSHTIFIDGDKLYSGVTTFRNNYQSPMTVFSLANPERPQLIADINVNYPGLVSQVHDMYVKDDTIYASCAYDGLQVLTLGSNNALTLLGSVGQYNFQGYNHSSCLIDSGRHLVMLDEVPESLPCKVVRVNGPANLEVVDTFSTRTRATPHNPFACVNNRVAIAYYEDGLQIYDFSNPENALCSGYFDTHYQSVPATNNGGYKGAWGAYTMLPSGNIIVSDMQNGLFILNADSALGLPVRDSLQIIDTTGIIDTTVIIDTTTVGINNTQHNLNAVFIYPNPAIGTIAIKAPVGIHVQNTIVTDVQGKVLISCSQLCDSIPVHHLSPGYYLLRIATNTGTVVKRFIKQ